MNAPIANAPVKEGEVLAGKYSVERVLGVGGMGVVVAAKHLQLDQRVALKFLLPEASANAESVTRFEREARAAVKIQSEHVAKVLDVGKLDNGSPFMVMEYLIGSDLAEVLEARGILPLEDAIDWLLQACEAMAEAHSIGIIHRDLKPRNLFIIRRPDGSSSLKVLDFGISKSMAPGSGDAAGLTNTTAIMGSPLYMSPEQLRSSRDVDARTDIWSLGVILFEMLTAQPPFSALTMPQLCMAIVNDPPPSMRQLNAEVPEGLEAVVQRCLEKEPSNRYTSVAHFAHELGEFASERGRLSVERVERILQNVGLAETSFKGSRSGKGSAAASSTSTAWAESQRHKSGSRSGRKDRASAAPPPDPAPRKAPLYLALGAGVLLLAGGGLLFGLRGQSSPAGTPSPAVAAPLVAPAEGKSTVALALSSTPASARFFLDDTPLSGNPYRGKFPLDSANHQLRVEAPGFVTHRELVTFNNDVTLGVALDPEPVPSLDAAPPVLPRLGVGKLPPAAGKLPVPPSGKRPGLDTGNPYGQ